MVPTSNSYVGTRRWRRSVWKSKFYGAFAQNHRIVLHAIDATPARWRGDAGSTQVGNKRSHDDDGRFWIQLPDFRRRFRTVDLCRVKTGQLKERNVLKERTEAERAADAEASALEDDWLAEIPGASRAHDHASKSPKKQSSSKKKSKKKKKHKR